MKDKFLVVYKKLKMYYGQIVGQSDHDAARIV